MKAFLVHQGHDDALLGLSSGDEVLREVADKSTAAGVWLKRKGLYMTKSLTNGLNLKKRLH